MGLFGRKKADLFEACFGSTAARSSPAVPAPPAVPVIDVTALGPAPVRFGYHDGEKFPGGFGATNLLWTDYWTLRARSAELFQRNLFARGLIRRMVTNEINVGLHLEATPQESILGYPQDGLAEWGENIENRFALWANTPRLCDHEERHTFGELQAIVKLESLVVGDVLVVPRQDPRTKLPRIQLFNGSLVQTPMGASMGMLENGNRIVQGVELDKHGRHVAYHVRHDPTGMGLAIESRRLPAWGEKSGRRLAWLVYGTDRRHGEVRGQPLLSLVLQSLKELDRYRDAVQRKAAINAMFAFFVQKDADKPASRPMSNGGISRRLDTAIDNEGTERKFNVADYVPGVVLDELQVGEKPQAFNSNGTDEKLQDFQEAILSGVAWANEIPPEILFLSFSSNYSASQAAINEYKLYLNPARTRFGNAFCTPFYHDWMYSEALDGRIDAPGLLEAWRDPKQYDTHAAWIACDWAGNIKPAVDPSKLVKAYDQMVASGYITRDRATRELTGMKYSHVVRRLRIENAQLADANEPLVKLEALAKPAPQPPPSNDQNEDEDPDDVNREDDDKGSEGKAQLRVLADSR